MFRRVIVSIALLASFCATALAQDGPGARPQPEQIDGPPCAGLPQWFMRGAPKPCTPMEVRKWLDELLRSRNETRIRAGYDGSEYARPELLWAQSSFVQPQMMVHDRYFYDPAKHAYTVDRYLDDTVARYGGIDSVLVWPTYPNIGVDDRNQYDLFRDLPGGVAGIKTFVDEFHKRAVRVLFPTMLWDQGTRVEGKPDAVALAEALAAVGADGVNGDTLSGVPRSFRKASDDLHHPLALEPELWMGSEEQLQWNNMSWGYWKYDFVPTVSKYKWLESRHMVNISNRWAHDHTDDLQFAFFNGIGFESWENIWGIWNQMTPRDAEALRRTALIERTFKTMLVAADWQPHYPMLTYGAFSSRWPEGGDTLWTVVNRNAYSVSGRQMSVPHVDGVRYFDVWNGRQLTPESEGKMDVLSFEMEAGGFGAVLATTGEPSPRVKEAMHELNKLSSKPLSSFTKQWSTIPQQAVAIAKTKVARSAPEGMRLVPAANYEFRVNGVEIEGTNDEGVDVQYAGEASARRYHDLKIRVGAFYIDTYPVTDAQFKKFIDATHYQPADDHNFLRDWKNGSFPAGWDDKPVTWVSLEDARAYATWAGKRLPHEWEWQYAAQGTDGRDYPWGRDWSPSAVPAVDNGRIEEPAADVHAHANGASPFGVQDLVGNVWQWTDEYLDEHTRAAIIRGGSHYQPSGSNWYFPQAYKLSEHGKYLLMAPSLDRSASIGFRCVEDAE